MDGQLSVSANEDAEGVGANQGHFYRRNNRQEWPTDRIRPYAPSPPLCFSVQSFLCAIEQ